MLKYYFAAASLKLLSSSPISRRLYRYAGNRRNEFRGQHEPIDERYLSRSEGFLRTLRDHGALRPGARYLEVGTGWVHWESILLRAEVNCDIVLYDVWDNRCYNRFASYIKEIHEAETWTRLGLEAELEKSPLRAALHARRFEEVYERLGFTYLLDSTGLLSGFSAGQFDLTFGSDVGEHIPRSLVPTFLERSFRVLKPGGFLLHQIVLEDHLRLYDPSAHPKHYLTMSGRMYDTLLNNRLQYINRLQLPEWLHMLVETGFEILAVDRISSCDTSELDIHKDYRTISEEDLRCTVVRILSRRPKKALGTRVTSALD